MTGEVGTIYVIHFHEPYQHAAHYGGWSRYLEARLRHHLRGTSGVALMRAVYEAGIRWEVALTFPGTRDDERRMKNRGSLKRICPICKAAQ